MNRLAKPNGFALLLAVFLLLNPISRCAMMAAPASPSTPSSCPTHPSPEPKDSSQSVCSCLTFAPPTGTNATTGDRSASSALPVDRINPAGQCVFHDLFSPNTEVFALYCRFIAIHQFRI
jgi:hypothetical protein